jgi:hypothetical protein
MRKTSVLIVSIAVLVILGPAHGAAQRAVDRTGEISGMVTTTAEPAVPLSRVLVTLSGASLKPGRTVISDERGGFTFTDVPAGSFTIVASRPPYVKTAFGARRAGRPGSTIELAAGQRLTGLRIALARGAAITGVVRNADGEPAPEIQITATALDPRVENAGVPFTSDDRGIYRVFGLTPGRYLVRAAVPGGGSGSFTRISDAEMDEILTRLQRRPAMGSTSAVQRPRRPYGGHSTDGCATHAHICECAHLLPGNGRPVTGAGDSTLGRRRARRHRSRSPVDPDRRRRRPRIGGG